MRETVGDLRDSRRLERDSRRLERDSRRLERQ